MSGQVCEQMPEVPVVGLGALTAIGQYPEAIAAAAAAGICRYRREESIRHPVTGDALTLALLSTLPAAAAATSRMTLMGARAAAQALAPLVPHGTAGRLAALISLPPERPGMDAAATRAVARTVMAELGHPLVPSLCGIFDSGHEGGIAAFAQASTLLSKDAVDFCLVGGIDTYRDPDTLAWLGRAGRLKDDKTPHGLVPGEAAAFALLSTPQAARRLRLRERGLLLGIGRAAEPSPWYSGRSTQARGLTAAIRSACAALPPDGRAELTYCDANGEPWRADEWSYAYLRTAHCHRDPMALRHPADCWGDVGAASAVLLLNTALIDIARGRTRGPRALVWCASDTRPFRGALLCAAERQEVSRWA